MNILFIFLFYTLSQLIKPSVNAVVIPEDKNLFEMPEYLNTDTFYPQVSKKLTIVEFFLLTALIVKLWHPFGKM